MSALHPPKLPPAYQPAMPGWFCAPSTTTFVPLSHDARADSRKHATSGDLVGPPQPSERELDADPLLEGLGVVATSVTPAAAGNRIEPG